MVGGIRKEQDSLSRLRHRGSADPVLEARYESKGSSTGRPKILEVGCVGSHVSASSVRACGQRQWSSLWPMSGGLFGLRMSRPVAFLALAFLAACYLGS